MAERTPHARDISSTYKTVGVITPGSTTIDPPLRSVVVTVAGDYKPVLFDDADSDAVAVPVVVGQRINDQVVKKILTGTTATVVGYR